MKETRHINTKHQGRPQIIARLCLCMSILLLAGCFNWFWKDPVKALDNAIRRLETQSVSWQRVVEDTRDELIQTRAIDNR